MSGDPAGYHFQDGNNQESSEKNSDSYYEDDAKYEDGNEVDEGDSGLDEIWKSDAQENLEPSNNEGLSEESQGAQNIVLPDSSSKARDLVPSAGFQRAHVSLNDSVMGSSSQLAQIFKDLIQRATGIATLSKSANHKLYAVRDLKIRTEEAKVAFLGNLKLTCS